VFIEMGRRVSRRPQGRRTMLDTIRALFGELAGGTKEQDRFAEDDYRLAAAALLIHVVGVDGAMTERERSRLHHVVKYRFNLDDEATEELIAEATVIEGESVDLYGFTSLLNRSLDEEGRRRIIEMLWEMIYADGNVNEFEDNMVWRVADLLGVPARDRIASRQQVAAESGHGDAGASAAPGVETEKK
jgi:uncharacterized tellurite resistance protein B-like protein